jgi:hypothetical protein
MEYLPNDVNFNHIRKSLLFAIIKEARPDMYADMEVSANVLKQKRRMKKMNEFLVSVPEDTLISLKREAKLEENFGTSKSTFVKVSKRKKIIGGVKQSNKSDSIKDSGKSKSNFDNNNLNLSRSLPGSAKKKKKEKRSGSVNENMDVIG